MKKLSILVFLFASFSLVVKAQHDHAHDQKPAAATPAIDNPNAADMTFEFETYDYGTIKQGADGNVEFKFKNTGKEPLVITEAHGSCGCTVPTYPKEPIMKGQTASIKVHYDTNRIGAFSKTVSISSNAKGGSKTLTIKGNVEAVQALEQGLPLKNTEGAPVAK